MNSYFAAIRKTNASDAIAWKRCRRQAWFDLRADSGMAPDPFERLVMQAGIEHEQQILASLGDHVVAEDPTHTRALMAAKTSLIYQPKFEDDARSVVAQPDFLLLEGDRYRAADAKLARSIANKSDLRIQLAVYQLVLEADLPTQALLADDNIELIGDKDLQQAEAFLSDMQTLATSERPIAHFSASRCSSCPYSHLCLPGFEEDGDLGLNYFIDARAISSLEDANIRSLADLADANPDALADVPYFKGDKKRKAVLHAQALMTGQAVVMSAPEPIAGTAIHFDIETNPLAAESAEEVYLWGFLLPPYSVSDFEYIWHDGGKENDTNAWYAFLERVGQLRNDIPDTVLVHYARFERDVIKRYAVAHDQVEHPTVDWLLNSGGLVDLRDRVTKTVILPTRGYGLKEICKHEGLANFQWELDESGSQWSVVRYNDYLNCSDPESREAIKTEILTYNRDDVRATRALEEWLSRLHAQTEEGT